VGDKELDTLDRAGTWDVENKIQGGKEVGSKWIFNGKRLADRSINKFKARLVAQLFIECLGYDFHITCADIVHVDCFQLLLAIMAGQGWHPQQVDINSLFHDRDLEKEIYMTLLEGYMEKGKIA
jgi:hypothetical protein